MPAPASTVDKEPNVALTACPKIHNKKRSSIMKPRALGHIECIAATCRLWPRILVFLSVPISPQQLIKTPHCIFKSFTIVINNYCQCWCPYLSDNALPGFCVCIERERRWMKGVQTNGQSEREMVRVRSTSYHPSPAADCQDLHW